jgi:hypothetical protein
MIWILVVLIIVLVAGFIVGYEAGKCQGWIDCEANYKPVLDRWREECLKPSVQGGGER